MSDAVKHVIGVTADLLQYIGEVRWEARGARLARLFQPLLERLKLRVDARTYQAVVRLMNMGQLREADELLHTALDRNHHTFSQPLADDWDSLIVSRGGIGAVEESFLELQPVFL